MGKPDFLSSKIVFPYSRRPALWGFFMCSIYSVVAACLLLGYELSHSSGNNLCHNTLYIYMAVTVLGSFGDDEPKAPPTKSDVTDILNMAHGGHTKNSLKPVHTHLHR